MADLTRTIELDPGHAAAFNSRGELHAALGNTSAAEADYTEAIRLDASMGRAYLNRASVRSRAGRFAEAVTDSNEAIRLDARLTTAYLVRGSAYAQTNFFEPAINDFTEVLRRDGDNDQAFYLRGVARSKLNDYAGAQADLSEALRLDPSNARAFAFRGLSRQALKQIESSVSDYANAVRLDGRYAAAYCNQLAALHSARGEYEMAAADYSLILLFDPANDAAKAGRDQALRDLLARPAPKPIERREAATAAPTPQPQARVEKRPRPAAETKQVRPIRRERPKPAAATATVAVHRAPKTETMPAAAAAAIVAAAAPAAEADESSAEFVIGPGAQESVEIALASDSGPVEQPPSDEPAEEESSGLLLEEPDTDEEQARLERLKEQRLQEQIKAEESARLQRLAAERQRMLDEVKRKKSDIDRSRRMKKRTVARENDGGGIIWTEWIVPAGVLALVLWGGYWAYGFFFGSTISPTRCYPCHGSVTFADGRPVQGGTLILDNHGDEHEADISPDGKFQTKTYSAVGFDGVPAGEYKAYLLLPSTVDPEAVPMKYRNSAETPWAVSVKRQDNTVDLVIQ
jgi:tetratricopeptide (TPR) repeat protein